MKFTIPGEPVPKLRPRVYRKGGMRVFTPQKTLDYEAKVRLMAQAAGLRPLDGPLCLTVEFVHRLPKGQERKRKPVTEYRLKPTKPDLDNLVKALMDGLEGVAFESDSQVVVIHALKWWGRQGEDGHTDVEIEDA